MPFYNGKIGERVTTTNFTTSKFKKNNVESEKDQNIESENITTSKVVDHFYENQNVEKNEKNVESLIFV
jgi:hypothetical protein